MQKISCEILVLIQNSFHQLNAYVLSLQVLGHMGSPSNIGTACLYLAADATYCTGIDINISGGVDLSVGNKVEAIF